MGVPGPGFGDRGCPLLQILDAHRMVALCIASPGRSFRALSRVRHLRRAPVLLVCWLVAPVMSAQTVPIRPLGRFIAQTTTPLRTVVSVRQLSDGHVFVEDGLGRRVLLFDSTLTRFVVVLDSSGTAVRAYGPSSRAPLYSYRGDTTLFFDIGAQSFVVLNSTGHVVRTIAPPVPADAVYLATFGPRFDSQGRLVYRATRSSADRPNFLADGSVSRRAASEGASSPICALHSAAQTPTRSVSYGCCR